MRNQYPDQFILIGNVIEEKMTESTFRILGGELIEVSKDPKKILCLYQEYKRKGKKRFICLTFHA